MANHWLIGAAEDEQMQGLTADAQVIYMRLFRRYMDFDTGRVEVSLSQMKRAIEYIPDGGSHQAPRRVCDISNNYVRARVAELERAGLIDKAPKRSKFDTPAFRCLLASYGQVRPEKEPQRNHKEGTTRAETGRTPELALIEGSGETEGTTKEPQGGNHKTSGVPGKDSSPNGDSSYVGDKSPMSGKPDCIDRILAYLNERAGRHYKSVETNRKFVGARLKEGFSEEDCRAVIDRQVARWMGTEMEGYLRPATLFNATKFAQYHGEIGAPIPEHINKQEALEARNRAIGQKWAKARGGGNA